MSTDWMKIVKTYPYVDEQGKLLFEVCRLEPKDFKQRRKIPNTNEWGWALGAGTYYRRQDGSWHIGTPLEKANEANAKNLPECRRVLYGLDKLTEKPKDPLVVVEGEKDVETLWGLGLLATCNVGGAGKWKREYSNIFQGRRVAIIADGDGVGLDHAGWVLANACIFGAESVRLIKDYQANDITHFLEARFLLDKKAEARKAVIDLIRSYRELK